MALPKKLYTTTGPVSFSKKLHHTLITPQTGEALAIGTYQIANRSGANADVGLFARQPNALWEAGIITAASTPDYGNAVAGAKSTTANAFANVFTTVNNDGFLVLSAKKFAAISFVVDVAANGSPVFAYKYYNGSTMTDLPTLSTPDFANTGASQLIFLPPVDWVAGTTAAVQTTNTTAYALEIIASTAPGKKVSISDVRVYEQLDYFDAVTDGNQLVDDLKDTEVQLPVGYSIAPFFDSANTANFASVSYRAMSRQV